MCKCKEEDYKYEDYIDEYSGIPESERTNDSKTSEEMVEAFKNKSQLEFDFDTERCPAYDK